jgi:hypothetical protein
MLNASFSQFDPKRSKILIRKRFFAAHNEAAAVGASCGEFDEQSLSYE